MLKISNSILQCMWPYVAYLTKYFVNIVGNSNCYSDKGVFNVDFQIRLKTQLQNKDIKRNKGCVQCPPFPVVKVNIFQISIWRKIWTPKDVRFERWSAYRMQLTFQTSLICSLSGSLHITWKSAHQSLPFLWWVKLCSKAALTRAGNLKTIDVSYEQL